MSTMILNEHDANQGAQSKGEFLGMTGNSGWYLLGSAGASVMMVILLWGVLGISLLLCISLGIVLCLLSVAYVFTLKNNKPDHYDTDFFSASIFESGVTEIGFSPRWGGKENPVAGGKRKDANAAFIASRATGNGKQQLRLHHAGVVGTAQASQSMHGGEAEAAQRERKLKEPEPMVTRKVYDNLKAELMEVEDQLTEALSELGEVNHES